MFSFKNIINIYIYIIIIILMGITIESYPVYNGATSLQNVYLNIRDLKTTKETNINIDNVNENIYRLEFIVNYIFDNNTINTNFI